MNITVFTPTFNRAHLLERLFNSLKAQDPTIFEWIIVDDGSTDGTERLVSEFSGHSFSLRYIRQVNQGKHIAINRGVQEAKGELFFIVDSDDYLVSSALDEILSCWQEIRDDAGFAGIVPNRCYSERVPIGNPAYQQLDSNPVDFRFKYKEQGDKAELIRTSIFKAFPFPETPREKFCPEALFLNRLIAYKLRYINRNLYVCEYLEDGLTAKIFKVRKESPVNTCLCYTEISQLPIDWLQRFKAAINFYRFKRYTTQRLPVPGFGLIPNLIARLIAKLMYIISDRKK